MTPSFIPIFSTTSLVLIILHLLLLYPYPYHCLNYNIKQSSSSSYSSLQQKYGVEEEIKTRLGSTPPSCHNKCNQCHPCAAVQVPSHDRSEPHSYLGSSPSSAGNAYSNYKPLGWKCRCDGHFYNP